MNFTNESIFITALRGLLKSFAVVIGIALGVFVLMLGVSTISNSVDLPEKSDLTVSPDAEWNCKLLPESTPVILRIDIHGVIGTGNLRTEKVKNMLIDSRQGTLSKNRVKGILLHMNTPGGTSTDSQGIYQLLMDYKEKYKVPIYAYVHGMSASGGVYISCAAEKIFASESSIIGSVGARLGPAFNFSSAMEKVGISSLTLTEGKNKDALNPFRPWKEDEAQEFKNGLAVDYEQFVNTVVKARKRIDKEKLINEYGASIFIAPKAEELGYIDNGDASYDLALSELVKTTGINGKYQVLEIEPHQSVIKDLAQTNTSLLKGKIHHVFPTGAYTTTEMSGQILYLYQP